MDHSGCDKRIEELEAELDKYIEDVDEMADILEQIARDGFDSSTYEALEGSRHRYIKRSDLPKKVERLKMELEATHNAGLDIIRDLVEKICSTIGVPYQDEEGEGIANYALWNAIGVTLTGKGWEWPVGEVEKLEGSQESDDG